MGVVHIKRELIFIPVLFRAGAGSELYTSGIGIIFRREIRRRLYGQEPNQATLSFGELFRRLLPMGAYVPHQALIQTKYSK